MGLTPAPRRRRAPRPALLAGALLALAACRTPPLAATGDTDVSRLHAVMVNGGGTPSQNYQSHFLHVQHLYRVLVGAGVPPERITVFSADGTDATADLAVREAQPERDFWLLRGTKLERPLRTPVTYADSALPGAVLRPATQASLGAWFAEARPRLHAGDTLLVYVTDHGTKNAEDTTNNAITLWGSDEALSVVELRELLAGLDPGVRVVTLMSQCFSGAFARLVSARTEDGEPAGTVCGYFSSTAERPAYGCYPENRGKNNVGHSFHFFEALGETPRLREAHERVLVTDRTPDVPLRSSDVYLEDVLARAARAAGEEPAVFADARLAEAWRDRAAWEPEIRLLDRIAQSFGTFSPRSLRELQELAARLPEIAEQLRTHERAWRGALGDAARANLDRFLVARPAWRDRTAEPTLAAYQPAAVRALAGDLLGELGDFTRADDGTDDRLRLLRRKGETAAAAAYRMEVRLGALLRMRAVLVGIAGRVHLASRGTAAERAAYARLRACEDLALVSSEPAPALAAGEPFPAYEDDVRLARRVLPAWMGINFRQAPDQERTARGLGEGTAAVLHVYPDSPAAVAGLQAGDLVLGPPGAPFSEPGQIRQWVMLSRVDEPAALAVVRGEQRLEVTLVPKPFPLKWPALPGPPKAGTAAPPLELSAYRGGVPERLDDGTPHLLFFWATWCAPCKASLPDVLAFERDRGTPVIAVTDEPAATLDAFFKAFGEPFPARVAIDEYRAAFLAYGVSGTPTYVLVDGAGRVQEHATGYRADRGLALAGWRRASAPPPSP